MLESNFQKSEVPRPPDWQPFSKNRNPVLSTIVVGECPQNTKDKTGPMLYHCTPHTAVSHCKGTLTYTHSFAHATT